MSTPALDIRRLTVSYGGNPVLWGVDASFPAGSLSAIVGPNGAGKSTLLQAVLGLVPADAGVSLVGGRPAASARDEVAYVPQREAVDWDFPITVAEVVEMGRYRSAGWVRRPGHRDKQIVSDALERVGMGPYAKRQIGRLSGGQRQRVFVARALAQQAKLLLLDEPFSGIDARTEATLLGLFRQLNEAGTTIVCVHHDLETVRQRFDWVLVLNVRTIACGPTTDVMISDTLHRAYGGAPAASDASDARWAG